LLNVEILLKIFCGREKLCKKYCWVYWQLN